MKAIVMILATVLLAAASVSAQRTTRPRLKPAALPAKVEAAEIFDTISVATDTAAVDFTGYEKLLTSTKESFFVTNNTDSLISRLVVKIEYFDMKHRRLDSRTVTFDIDIAPGETRKADIKSWDKQKVFYYYRSRQPKVAQATPYRVRITLDAALRRR